MMNAIEIGYVAWKVRAAAHGHDRGRVDFQSTTLNGTAMAEMRSQKTGGQVPLTEMVVV
jgi:hypothetical protein